MLRAAAPDHVQVGASANGFKTSTTEWLGGGTTPGMVVPDGGSCHGLRIKLCSGTSTAIAHMCLGCTVSACQTAANVQLQNGLILKGINAATHLFRLQSKGIA